MENWKPIKNLENRYMISDHGNVRSLIRNRIMKPNDNGHGYKQVCFQQNKGKRKPCYIHRLVAEYFIPNPDGKEQVNHIDFNKSNNHKSNLEWVTAKQNANHAWAAGVIKQPPRMLEEDNPRAILSVLKVQAIRELHPQFTIKELSAIFNASWSTIKSIIIRNTWAHVKDRE